MAKKNYYAVLGGKGGASGVYRTWAQCQAQVAGVSGARYQGFATLEEAQAFLAAGGARLEGAGDAPPKKAPPPMPFREGAAVAYVDGSYRADTQEFSCGAVLFWAGEKVEFSQKNDDPDLAQMRNVAGEIMGAVVAIRWCLERGVPALEIYHDYAGVGKWALGQWKTNRPGTQAYARFCAQARQRMELRFVQVRGHSGDYWNDEADRLAKEALNISR